MGILVFLILAYLLGSIPTAVWIGHWFYNTDVREFGSGNAGATNTFRVLGKKAGIPVLIVDSAKGYLAVAILSWSDTLSAQAYLPFLQLLAGVAALLGHIFPVFAQFRGGKGVATLLGVVLALQPMPCLFSILVFLMVLLLGRMVSLASIIAGLSYPIILHFGFHNSNPALSLFSCAVAVLLVLTHRKNIKRIIRREEQKIQVFSFRNP